MRLALVVLALTAGLVPAQSPANFDVISVSEQLGVKLETTKGPVDVVVIDHINRPSEN
jgi:uncharacterized protein (TIGR03435 family)